MIQTRTNSPSITRRQLLRGGGAAILTVGIAGPLAACSASSGGQNGEALAFWQFFGPSGESGQSDWLMTALETWNAENDVKVDPVYMPGPEFQDGTRLTTAFSSGEGPDIFVINPNQFLRYFNPGALHNLTSYLTDDQRTDFDDASLAPLTVDGKIYALPLEAEPVGMYYSVKAFEDAGLAEGDIPTTWDQLIDVAELLRKEDQFGILLETRELNYQAFQFYPWLWLAGSDLVTEDGTASAFNSPGTVAALELWQHLVAEDFAPRSVLGSGSSDAVANLASGYCAMQPTGIHEIGHLSRDADEFEYGVFPLPSPDGTTRVTVTGGWSLAVNAESPNADAAADFCAWLTAGTGNHGIDRMVDFNASKGNLPVRQMVQDAYSETEVANSESFQTFLSDILPTSRFQPRYQQEIIQIAIDAIQQTVLAGVAADDAAAEASDRIDDFIAGYQGAPLV